MIELGNSQIIENLRLKLFSDQTGRPQYSMNVFAIIDGAALQSLYNKLQNTDVEHQCLYTGFIADELEEVAPYLVKLESKHAFTDWLLKEGYGKNSISFIKSHNTIKRLAKHFQNYTLVDLEQESPNDPDKAFYVFYAFYDPRVVGGHMNGMSQAELLDFFKPIVSYYCESSNNSSLIDLYSLTKDNKFMLVKETLQLATTEQALA